MNIVIIGGGYLGQLLHTLVPSARVLDWRPRKPHMLARQFGPQYLWRPIPGLPNREFSVLTYVDGNPATDEAVLRYKQKVGKEQDNGDWRAQFQTQMPGYEVTLPEDRVEYGQHVDNINFLNRELTTKRGEQINYDWLISTIPLPSMLELCGIPTEEPFESRPIYVRTEPTEEKRTYLYVNYLSDDSPVYRETIREGQRHLESLEPIEGARILKPGKIYPHRSAPMFLAELRISHILSVGRYGAWQSDELAHETWQDVRNWKAQVGA